VTGLIGGACLDTNHPVGAKQLVCVLDDTYAWYLCLRLGNDLGNHRILERSDAYRNKF